MKVLPMGYQLRLNRKSILWSDEHSVVSFALVGFDRFSTMRTSDDFDFEVARAGKLDKVINNVLVAGTTGLHTNENAWQMNINKTLNHLKNSSSKGFTGLV